MFKVSTAFWMSITLHANDGSVPGQKQRESAKASSWINVLQKWFTYWYVSWYSDIELRANYLRIKACTESPEFSKPTGITKFQLVENPTSTQSYKGFCQLCSQIAIRQSLFQLWGSRELFLLWTILNKSKLLSFLFFCSLVMSPKHQGSTKLLKISSRIFFLAIRTSAILKCRPTLVLRSFWSFWLFRTIELSQSMNFPSAHKWKK